ncbi:MAG: YceH family protein [Gammaproteobacteria bacterium]
MMLNLSANETRVIGCLMEKSVVTPEQYPLTLNALTNACNQKSSRNPVMSLDPGVVKRTIRELQDKHLVQVDENFKRGVEKYKHLFCNTRLGEYQFDPAQFAIVCLLLLRGPQTPGELRARSGRLHTFADNDAVVESLNGLIEREGEPLVVKLPRTPGRKDAEYMHLFSGPIDVEEYQNQTKSMTDAGSSERVSVSELERRLSSLEKEVAELKAQLKASDD